MNTTYLLLGSNIGESELHLSEAIINISNQTGTILNRSAVYSTAAWGNTDQPDFLNQVIKVATKLGAAETLQSILRIEKNMGRVRTIKNAPRVIDIDILFFNHDIIRKKDLTIPHPEIQNRRFVLIPMNELAQDFIHPVLNQTMYELLLCCPDQLDVRKFSALK